MDRILLDCNRKGCKGIARWVLTMQGQKGFTRSCHKHLHLEALKMLAPKGYQGSVAIESI